VTFGSLFAGFGGFDLGFERAGMTCRWQVEIEPYARAVLTKHWPGVRRHEDIRGVGVHNLERVDVICGGFPCQPFSSASRGRRHGNTDDRALWPEMRRVVSELRPTWVVAENVPQFDRGPLDEMVTDLEALDYEVAPPLEVPACAFGLDHWRPRLWILGYTDRHGEPGLSVDAEVARLSWCGRDTGGMGTPHVIPGRMERLEGIGNAVPPVMAQWIGERLMACSSVSD
jgi:DNA (cytosine-5)-methyltransferase 1